MNSEEEATTRAAARTAMERIRDCVERDEREAERIKQEKELRERRKRNPIKETQGAESIEPEVITLSDDDNSMDYN